MAAKRAASHLGAASVPSGKYDVIFDGRAMVSLLGAFCRGILCGKCAEGLLSFAGQNGRKNRIRRGYTAG